MNADNDSGSSSESVPDKPLFMLFRAEMNYDAEELAELHLHPDDGEKILRDYVRDSPESGEVIVREGKENRSPHQLDFSDIGVFYVVHENGMGRTWIVETTDEEEAREEIEQWFDGGIKRLYYEGTLIQTLWTMIGEGSAQLAE